VKLIPDQKLQTTLSWSKNRKQWAVKMSTINYLWAS